MDEREEHGVDTPPRRDAGLGPAVAFGIAIGAGLMATMGPAGLAVGIAIGIGTGVAMRKRRR